MNRANILGGAAACVFVALALLAAHKPPSTEEITTRAYLAALAVGDNPKACRSTIGKQSALALVRYCLWVSSGTRPPCNTGNSCAGIVDHIQRNCEGEKPQTLPCAEGTPKEHWRRISRFPAL